MSRTWYKPWESLPSDGQSVYCRINRWNWPAFESVYHATTGMFESKTNGTLWNKRLVSRWSVI